MVRRSPASANPVAFTRKSILPKPPQSAILILVAWTWGDWNWRKLTLWSGVEKGKTRGWVGRGVIWDVPQLSILWEFVRNMLKIKSSRAFYLSKRCTSKRILTIYKGFAENKYYKLFGHPTIFITPPPPQLPGVDSRYLKQTIPLLFWRVHKSDFDGVTFISRVRQMVHRSRVMSRVFILTRWWAPVLTYGLKPSNRAAARSPGKLLRAVDT